MSLASGHEAGGSPVYLIDASVFIFRAFYSVPVSLTDPDGQPVNALHGFARFIGDLIESVGPRHMAVAFDESLATSFRNRIYPPYKAHREPAPEELKAAVPAVSRVLQGFRAGRRSQVRSTRPTM